MEESEIQSAKEDIFKRLDKRKENLEQQRSANISERSKNAAENQAILNKVSQFECLILVLKMFKSFIGAAILNFYNL